MRFSFLLLCLALFTLVAGAKRHRRRPDACRKAFLECDWEFLGFHGKIPTIRLNPPDVALTTQVVSKDEYVRLGILNTNGIVPEFIMKNHKVIPITKFGLTPTHFKPFAIRRIMGSGVGHETFQKGQLAIASGKCVRVFFTHYQKFVGGHPPDVRNLTAKRRDFKCVVFRTKKH